MNYLLLAAAMLSQTGAPRPPTVDPTYGFPVPSAEAPAVRRGTDAKWIWAGPPRDNQTVYLQRNLTLPMAPRVAGWYVTADDYFTAYVNGQKVGETGPEAGNDSVWSQVRRYDVANLLHEGANVLSIVGRNSGGAAGVLARLEVDGKPADLTGPAWNATQTEPPAGWLTEFGSARIWAPATIIGPSDSDPWVNQLKGWPVELNVAPPYLKHLRIAPVRWAIVADDFESLTWHQCDSMAFGLQRPSSRRGDQPWSVIFDFGKELSGRAEVATGPSGQTPSLLGTGESIGEAIQKPYTSLALSANKSIQSGPYSAFRYVVLSSSPDTPAIGVSVWVDHLYYPVKYAGGFSCSDPLLTKIWYTGAYTAHLCMQQDIWDAPKRDRARWMGDLHVSGEVINDAFLDTFLMEQTMRRLRNDAQGGAPPDAPPKSHVNGIPGYSCAWIAGLADFYRHTGDQAYLQSQHQALLSMLEFMRGDIGSDGIFANRYKEWPFVDWAPEFNSDTPSARAATHLFFVQAVREAVFLLRFLGDEENARLNAGWAELLALSAQSKLVGTEGTFGDRRQENAMAIYSGVATPEQAKHIFAEILAPGSPAWNFQATPYYNNYVIYAMSMAGHTPEALDFVRRYWGGMLAEGATTFWEGYDPKWDKHNAHIHLQADNGEGYFVSLCHGWSAGATSWLTEEILGVRSTGPGFATCEIQPNLADLKWAEGTVPTPHGPIHVRLDRTTAGLRARIAVPSGVAAKVTIPGRGPVTVSGGSILLRS